MLVLRPARRSACGPSLLAGARLLAQSPAPSAIRAGTRRRSRRVGRQSASTRRPTSRGSRPRPPTTCSPRCRASPSARRIRASAALARRRENVLINGQRIANKSGGAVDAAAAHRARPTSSGSRSSMPPASASPGCPARSPTSSSRQRPRSSGQFEWNPSFRAHFAKPEYVGGSISYSGKPGRSTTRCRSRTTPAAAASAGRS